jgi:hypothetical protein
MTIIHDAMPAPLPKLLSSLAQHGWATHVTPGEDVVGELSRIGDMLGARVTGRAGALEEVIKPQAPADAHPRSLSAQFGLNALPFHVELSHRPRPCRYVLLGCLDPGLPSAATILLDWQKLDFSPAELRLLYTAPILVRSGRRSFYSTLLSPQRAFLRYDPGCIEAVEGRGRDALVLLQHRLRAGLSEIYQWRSGDILIIDNWRALHGRASSWQGSGRRLARILIDD